MPKNANSALRCLMCPLRSMVITEDVRKYASENVLTAAAVLRQEMAEKCVEFAEKCGKSYGITHNFR